MTRKTMVPKFQINRKNIAIFTYLQNTKDQEFTLKLKNSAGKVVLEFPIVVDELRSLGTSLKEKIYCLPIVILEYSHGFFTTPDMYDRHIKTKLAKEALKEAMMEEKLLKLKEEPSTPTKTPHTTPGVPPSTPQSNTKIPPEITTDSKNKRAVVDFNSYFLLMNKIASINSSAQRTLQINKEENAAHIEKIDRIDYNLEIYSRKEHIKRMKKEKELIALRKNNDLFRLSSREEINNKVTDIKYNDGLITYKIDDLLVIHTIKQKTVNIYGTYDVIYSTKRTNYETGVSGAIVASSNETIVLKLSK